jgi:hypothetical protein
MHITRRAKLSSLNFYRVPNKFINENYYKLSHVNKNKTLNLFVDVAKISNKYGVTNIGKLIIFNLYIMIY